MAEASIRSTISIATPNVCSLSGKLGNVLKLADSNNVDTLCLQETRLNRDNLHALQGIGSRSWLDCTYRFSNCGPPLAAVCRYCDP